MTNALLSEVVQDSRRESVERARARAERFRSARPAMGALAVYLRSFALMQLAGVNMYSSLLMLGRQSEDERIRLASLEMAEDVAKGLRLSQAMAVHPNIFTNFQLSLVQVAEKTGHLDEILLKLADYEEKSSNTARKVKAALTYPAFIFLVCMVMLIFAPPFLFAGIFPMLKDMGQKLPLVTKVVISASEAVRNPFFVLLLAGLGYGLGRLGIHLFTHPSHRVNTHRRLLKVPVLGPLLRTVAVSRFTRSLGVQLGSGANVLEALGLAGQSSQSPVLQEAIPGAIAKLKNGRPLSRCLKETEFFPGMVVHLLRVGEETGELSDLLGVTARWYDDEVDTRIETLAACIEPLVMLIMGACVGTIVIALLLPLMNLVANL